jgi:ABC-type lipoprotein release transport system permease subunit
MMAVYLSNFMVSINEGMFNHMLDNMTRSFLGHIQVHQTGYWDDPTLDNCMEQDAELEDKLLASGHIETISPRFESFALGSFGVKTRGTMVLGVNPESEKSLMDLETRVVAGRSISLDRKEIVIGDKLAEYLGMQLGDTLVLIGQGYHGVSAAGKYEVVGFLQMPSPSLNGNLVVMPLGVAQYLYSGEGLVTGYTMVVSDLEEAHSEVLSAVDTSKHEVMTWLELMPEMVQMKTTKIAGTYIYVGILYLIAVFGIFATVLMMMAERSFEFGVMLSVGMSRGGLMLMMAIETLLISTLGVLAGTAVSYPFLLYMKVNPISLAGTTGDAMLEMGFEPLMITSTDPNIFITNGLLLFIISCLIVLYPTLKIWQMNPVKAMHK